MPQIHLRYGRTYIPFDYDEERFAVLGSRNEATTLRDVELGEKRKLLPENQRRLAPTFDCLVNYPNGNEY